MIITDELIDKLGVLARLEFSPETKEEIKHDLNRMLMFVEKLNELDTENISPLVYLSEEENILREDIVASTISQQDALCNAPQKDSDYFRVPKVIERI